MEIGREVAISYTISRDVAPLHATLPAPTHGLGYAESLAKQVGMIGALGDPDDTELVDMSARYRALSQRPISTNSAGSGSAHGPYWLTISVRTSRRQVSIRRECAFEPGQRGRRRADDTSGPSTQRSQAATSTTSRLSHPVSPRLPRRAAGPRGGLLLLHVFTTVPDTQRALSPVGKGP
jgi:hypothetical protein